jgi:hypothetical protein
MATTWRIVFPKIEVMVESLGKNLGSFRIIENL